MHLKKRWSFIIFNIVTIKLININRIGFLFKCGWHGTSRWSSSYINIYPSPILMVMAFFSNKNVLLIDSMTCTTGFLKILNENTNIKARLVGHGRKNVME